MLKSCSRCGKVHDINYKCTKGKEYRGGEERTLRHKYSWQKKSEEIRSKANYLCEVCKEQGRYTYDGLEVHHIEKLRDRKDLYLENTNLICLCQEHHKMADKNQIEKEYLKRLAIKREGNETPVGLEVNF